MGQGLSCDFEGAIEEVGKRVEQVQKEGLVSTITDSILEESPINATLIRAGTPQQTGLPWRNLRDQFLDGSMSTGLRRTHMGFIVFAGETIGMNEDDASLLENKFELDDELEIHCRAYWPRALRNYPLGIQPDGKPAYGPEYIIYSTGVSGRNKFELICNCWINDQKVVEPDSVEGSFWHATDRGKSVAPYYMKPGNYELKKDETDWYAYTQTRRWVIVGESDSSEEGRAVIRLGREIAKLPKGEHKIHLELSFRLLPGEENRGLFPAQPTPISYPIAVGEFTLEVTKDSDKVQKRLSEANKLPKRKTSLSPAECDRIEDAIWRLFKNAKDGWGGKGVRPEQPIHVVVVGEWFQINEGTRHAPIYKWTVPIKIVSKRRAALGWPKDQYTSISCEAVTPNFRKEANFTHLSVPLGSDSEIPAEFIPEELKSSSSRKATEKARKERLKKLEKERQEEPQQEEPPQPEEPEQHEGDSDSSDDETENVPF